MKFLTATSMGLYRRAIAVVAAIIMVASVVSVAGAPKAEAANRDWLRPDATGHCTWDSVGWWVQRCDVWSDSMGRTIPVQIQPAKRGGNAGLYLLDGLRATNKTNAWVNDVNAARLYEPHNITLVMPVGGAASFYADWNGPATYDLGQSVNYQWETFLTQELKATSSVSSVSLRPTIPLLVCPWAAPRLSPWPVSTMTSSVRHCLTPATWQPPCLVHRP